MRRRPLEVGGGEAGTWKTLRQLPDDLFLQPRLRPRLRDLQIVAFCPNPGGHQGGSPERKHGHLGEERVCARSHSEPGRPPRRVGREAQSVEALSQGHEPTLGRIQCKSQLRIPCQARGRPASIPLPSGPCIRNPQAQCPCQTLLPDGSLLLKEKERMLTERA